MADLQRLQVFFRDDLEPQETGLKVRVPRDGLGEAGNLPRVHDVVTAATTVTRLIVFENCVLLLRCLVVR